MKQLQIISFSPTGISLQVASQIAKAFDCRQMFIDLCEESTRETQIGSENICIFSVPCYGGRIPQTAAERLARIHGTGTPAVVCVTFGNRAFEDALLELAKCVESTGFHVVAGCAVSAEHNIMHIFGQGRPDILDQGEIRKFSVEVAQKIKSGNMSRPDIPGNYPYKDWHTVKAAISVDENTCDNCGLCAIKCPVKAISEDGRCLNEDTCINCMRCIKICPRKSRSVSEDFLTALIRKVGSACEKRKPNMFYK